MSAPTPAADGRNIRRRRRPGVWLLAVLLVLALAVTLAVISLNRIDETPVDDGLPPAPPGTATAAQLERGAYLARVGNCAGCHTVAGGAAYAGGRGIETPFGTVYAPNLTPHPEHGLGAWNADHFWRAMHHGRSRDGRLLTPAFPYPSYTQVTREDADALYAYLRSVPAVDQPNRAHTLRFPYGLQASLAVWRAMYFRPGRFEPDPRQSADWNRGAYLVQGLGHCAACHAPRNRLGATEGSEALGGGPIPMQGWYAPSLSDPAQAGVGGWSTSEVTALLRDGRTPRASVLGPMADVVFLSTQHWREDDLRATAVYLQSLKPQGTRSERGEPAPSAQMERGAQVYEQQCASCHGEAGQGGSGLSFPPLAGNRAVTMDPPTNLIRVVLSGGYPPTTAGHPRPHGMPPFAHVLSDEDIAAVSTYVRQSWGHAASPVTALEVLRLR